MLSYEAALQLILDSTFELGVEKVGLADCSRRYLAEPPICETDLPPFMTSSVDGFAILLPAQSSMKIVGEYPAGTGNKPPPLELAETVQVFTGSPLPPNTSCVVMIENARVRNGQLEIVEAPAAGENIRRQGEEMARGQVLGRHGDRISPALLALFANAGVPEVLVKRNPQIAVIEIGSELRDPGEPLGSAQIYAANGISLQAACVSLGAVATRHRTVDDPGEMAKTFRRALDSSDLVITSGGVSVGKHDHVRAVWSELGVEEVFWRAAIRPGKPVFFGKRGQALVFGLPGNPVSTLVTFLLFVSPSILKMGGAALSEWTRTKLVTDLEGAPQVDIFYRVLVRDGVALSLPNQGSHMLTGLAAANALLRIPAGSRIAAGEFAEALMLDW